MFRNYLLTTWALLKRKKFFTAITLFGITFTITVLLLLASLVSTVLQPGYPETKRARTLHILNIQQKDIKTGGIIKGRASYHFLEQAVSSLKTPEKKAIASISSPLTVYVNNKSERLTIKYANADFFDVVQYQLLEGRPFGEEQIRNGDKVVVISEKVRDMYFGDNLAVVGRYIPLGNDNFRVQGVYKNVPPTMFLSYADIIAPYTTPGSGYNDRDPMGNYFALLLAPSNSRLPEIRAEYDASFSRLPLPDKDRVEWYSHADSYLESLIRPALGERSDFKNSGFSTMMIALSLIILIFMLLPAINLMNINLSRIMERSSEIAVRKTFGASSGSLVWQFLIENIILSIVGGLLSLLLTGGILLVFNSSGLIPGLKLAISFPVLGLCLLLSVIFGVLSGVYPAWRMSRVQIIDALKIK